MKRHFMKRSLAMMMAVLLTLGLMSPLSAEDEWIYDSSEEYYSQLSGERITLNVYNWGEYISDGSDGESMDVVAAFEEITGINVNYTTFATNEELYAKLKSGASSYDVVIPSDYMIGRMINEGMLEELDLENIPNHEFIGEDFLGLDYDPENAYSVPYMWGLVGLIYNTTMIEDEIVSWDALWDERLMGNILMFSNSRDAFGIALTKLGYDLNTTDERELREAAELLKEQKFLVQAYVMDEIFDKMGTGEAAIAPYYAGDALIMMDENPDLAFAYPEEGTNRFVDAICIPKGSKNKRAAEMFINFLCETEVAVANCEWIGYSTPHTEVRELLDPELAESPVAYPPDEVLQNSNTFQNLPSETNKLMDALWTEIVSANTAGREWFVPITLLLMVAASIFINARRAYRKRKQQY